MPPKLDRAYRYLLSTIAGPEAPDVAAPFREDTIGQQLNHVYGHHGGMNWGTKGTSAALLGILVVLVLYQIMHLRKHPLEPVPVPVHKRTGDLEPLHGRRTTSVAQPAEVPGAPIS